MKPKKNDSLNLEKRRIIHLQVGLVVALSFVLVSLEWGTPQVQFSQAGFYLPGNEPETDLIPLTTREPEQRKELPTLLIPIPVDEEFVDPEIDIRNLFSTEDRGFGIDFTNLPDDPEPYVVEPFNIFEVGIKPEFPGGEQAMMKWLYSNVMYPQECIEHNIEGRVVAKFTISKFGKVTDIIILRTVHPLLDAEVIRVLKMMPDFRPGMQNGNLVPVFMIVPVSFNIQ